MKCNIKKGVLAECVATVVACFQEAGILNADPLIFLISTYLRKRASSIPVSVDSVDLSLGVGRRGLEIA
jgi:hypothetical protein